MSSFVEFIVLKNKNKNQYHCLQEYHNFKLTDSTRRPADSTFTSHNRSRLQSSEFEFKSV